MKENHNLKKHGLSFCYDKKILGFWLNLAFTFLFSDILKCYLFVACLSLALVNKISITWLQINHKQQDLAEEMVEIFF